MKHIIKLVGFCCILFAVYSQAELEIYKDYIWVVKLLPWRLYVLTLIWKMFI